MKILFVVAVVVIWVTSGCLTWQIEKKWHLRLDAKYPSTPTCWTKKNKLWFATACSLAGPAALLASLLCYRIGK